MKSMNDVYNHAMHWMNGLDKQDWLLVLVGAVVVGFLALRGFGSRTNY
jgi:hypothetical protein